MSDREKYIVDLFLEAYRQGAFPMAEPARPRASRSARSGRGDGSETLRQPARRVDWFIPDPRAVIDLRTPPVGPNDLAGFHISRSLARKLRRGHPFRITSDQAFDRVIRECAAPAPGREDSWIDETIIAAYGVLHRHGVAHSVEAWLTDPAEGRPARLVGGVYGVAVGGVFCAESMFSRPADGGTDASKVALAYLVRHLLELGFALLDVQIRNHHTDQFGVKEIPASEYQSCLDHEADRAIRWAGISPSWPKTLP